MPRAWGYAIVAVATIIGALALLVPIPEQIVVEQPEVPAAVKKPEPKKPAPALTGRREKPSPKSVKKPAPPPPPPKLPTNNTATNRNVAKPGEKK